MFPRVLIGLDSVQSVSGDLEMVRHSVAWIIKAMVECVVLFGASLIFFFSIDWLMAICLIALTPVILLITWLLKRKVGPMYVEQRERLSFYNSPQHRKSHHCRQHEYQCIAVVL